MDSISSTVKAETKLPGAQRFAEQLDHGFSPTRQQLFAFVIGSAYPGARHTVQPACCNRGVNMGIEFKFSVEGVENRHHSDAQPGSCTDSDLNDSCSQGGKRRGQMGIVSEQRPKH